MKKITTLLRQVPIIAIRDSVIFPHTDSILTFGRSKSVAAINTAFQEDKIVAIFTQKDNKVSDPAIEDLYPIGTISVISQMMSTEGEIHAIIKGQARVRLEKIVSQEPYILGEITEISELLKETDEIKALKKQLQVLFKKIINLGKPAEIMTVMKIVSGQVTSIELCDQIASLLDIKTEEKQKLLEDISLEKRMKKVLEFLAHELNVLQLERTISSKTQARFEDQMKRAVLRERKRAIEQELGEEESEMDSDELKNYRKKILQAKMPKDVRAKADKELKRLMAMSPQNPEGGYIRNYLDWLTDMPWKIFSPNNILIKNADKILKQDHYALDQVKERILEYLAVMQIKKSGDPKNSKKDSLPTILCFIGPPGVGKTSIGKSIAKALGRKFVRMSLGGIRDEAEIRGHRRTYVGALPGRIIQGIKNAGTANPVFMLDEIDKLGSDFRGDPSSALLEALDPEQNRDFSDHYLEVPFDLSKVMFITTGNVLEEIPGPLRDRMEVIRFSGYTQDEKAMIAEKFLWPKQLRLHGLENNKIGISPEGVLEIISRYTREAGVRNLERNLATVLRKIARLVAEKKKYPKIVEVANVRKFLGPQKFSSQIVGRKNEIGMSTGLGVTGAGGEIIFIEVSVMPGKGKLILTGQLGEVMKESAHAAFSWTRSHWSKLGLKADFADKIDVHIHVPEGSVPKDGPSAGIAITTALVSALTKSPVKREVGMTGEITLRGRVLEIGGVKEKVIAGHRAGLTTIILPKDNKKDMEEVPAKVKKDIKFLFAEEYEDVMKTAFEK